MRDRLIRLRFRLLPVVALAAFPVAAAAQDSCDVVAASAVAGPRLAWPAPLARTVTLHLRDVTVREALERIAAAARLRLSWSAEHIRLDRRVCLALDAAAAGNALVELLRGNGVEPVSAGGDRVVLAPGLAEPAPAAAPDTVLPLAPLRVDALPADPARRELPFVPGVLDRRRLTDPASANLAEALSAAVPGLWMWGGSATGLTTQYGSIRGASSFGPSAPKVYIDGVEVANPMLLAHVSPDAIERVEVIRGPQGAALYGADAIGGVTNITTRHDWVDAEAPRFRIRSGFGFASSDFGAGSSLAQDHSLGVRIGSGPRSAALNLTAGAAGEFIPGASSRRLGADGSVRIVNANSVLTGTLRLLDQRATAPVSPLLSDSVAGYGAGLTRTVAEPVSLRQLTAGLRAAWASDDRWNHTAVLGFDGYSIDGVTSTYPPALTAADSVLRAAGSGAVRGTLRMTSVARLDLGAAAAGNLTISAEHTQLRQFADSTEYEPGSARSSTGLSAQADVALHDRFFLTGGLRLEHNGTLETAGLSALPMLGGAWRAGGGPVTIKLRAAYGKGIRWPDLPAARNQGADLSEYVEHMRLGPEVQTGVEAGFDLAIGSALELQVTRFDQTASGLAQRVNTAVEPAYPVPAGARFLGRHIQSVGVIANHGWEMQASAGHGPVSLTGTLSLVDSRVRRLADGYEGDLLAGGRMLGVPARTWSLALGWTAPRWSASVTTARASDWINYDRIALARVASGPDGSEPAGAELRTFWRTYDGVTHLRGAFTRDISRGLTLVLSGDNLLGHQLGEPDNITVLPGRTLSLGFRTRF